MSSRENPAAFAVVGAGAVGGYFGARLAKAGHAVTFLARGATLDAIKSRGLRIQSLQGDFHVHPARATDDPSTVGPVDCVFVAVKAWQVAEVAPSLRPLIGPDTMLVPLQNGVEARDALAQELGEAHVIGGLCRILSRAVAPGHIDHFGATPNIVVGEWSGGISDRVRRLVTCLETSGVSAKASDDIQAKVWEKFLFITPLSGVGAATRMPAGILREQAEPRALLRDAMQEVLLVGRSLGVALPDDAPTRTMRFIDNLPAGATTSMQRDIMEGRPSELESQNGAVVRIGHRTATAVPVNTYLYRTLLPMERRARAPSATTP